MKLGVMSDTHGNHLYMQRAAKRMVEEFGCEVLIHLGDEYADAQKIQTPGAPVYAVPGMFEPAWEREDIPHRLITQFDGTTFLLSHTPTRDPHDRAGDIDPTAACSRREIEVLLHGHTHQRHAHESQEGCIIISPGHLKAAEDRGNTASFAILDIDRPQLAVTFVELEGGIIEQQRFTLD